MQKDPKPYWQIPQNTEFTIFPLAIIHLFCPLPPPPPPPQPPKKGSCITIVFIFSWDGYNTHVT